MPITIRLGPDFDLTLEVIPKDTDELTSLELVHANCPAMGKVVIERNGTTTLIRCQACGKEVKANGQLRCWVDLMGYFNVH